MPESAKCTGSDVSKWLNFFSKVPKENAPNISTVVEYLLSIPVSTAVEERVSSLMKVDIKSRSHRKLIEAELQIATNFSSICKELLQYVKQEKQLLESAKCQNKYN